MSIVNDLPVEVISEILNMLWKRDIYQCLFVNKRFYSASVLVLWKALEIYSKEEFDQCFYGLNSSKHHIGNNVKDITIAHYCIRGEEFVNMLPLISNLEALHIITCTGLTEESIMQVSQYCKQLRTLALGYSTISCQSAISLSHCSHLSSLYFKCCPSMTSEALRAFINLPIERLTIKHCRWLTTVETAHDVRSFACLKHLNIQIDNDELVEFIRCLTVDDKGMPYLPYLQTFGIEGTMTQPFPFDIPIVSFLKSHPHLRDLHLFSVGVSDEILKNLDCYLPDLESLLIEEECTEFSAQSIRSIVYCCPKLSKLEMYDCSFSSYEFPEIYHKLESFELMLDSADIQLIRAQQTTKKIDE